MKEYHLSREEFERLRNGEISYEEYNELIERLVNSCVEQALRMIPGVVDFMVRQATYLNQLSGDFYKNHPELAEHKELVGRVLEQVESENPGTPYEKLLEKTVPKAKQVLQGKKSFKDQDFSLSKLDEDLGEL